MKIKKDFFMGVASGARFLIYKESLQVGSGETIGDYKVRMKENEAGPKNRQAKNDTIRGNLSKIKTLLWQSEVQIQKMDWIIKDRCQRVWLMR